MAPPYAYSQHTYTVGIITALPIERAAMTVMLDERHAAPIDFVQSSQDPNAYTWGRIYEHNVVITSLAAGVYGTTMATTTALPILTSFPSIKFGLMVGIGAGVPNKTHDIRLGDVVISQPSGTSGGVFQYDLGKAKIDSWEQRDYLARPPEILLKALSHLQSEHELGSYHALEFLHDAAIHNERWGRAYRYPAEAPDRLFTSLHDHNREGEDCSSCDVNQEIKRKPRPCQDFEIHYGTIASGNSLVKNAKERDRIAQLEKQCICIEMEAAGLMNNFPCLVIRGICDYGDSHKNDAWQRYSSATAAAFAKELLEYVPKGDVQAARDAADIIDEAEQSSNINPEIGGDKVEQLLGKLWKGSYKDQKNRNSKRVDETCIWFTNHQLFDQWLGSDSFSLLWVSADPGCGKSVLSRYLIDEVLPAPNRVVCYFFFKDEQINLNDSTNALCALLHQLITHQGSSLDSSLLDSLTQSNFSAVESFDELWAVYISITCAMKAQEVVCVLDALDECKEDGRIQLFQAFGKLDTKKSTKLKLLMTARPYDDLKRQFRILHHSLPTIHLAGEGEDEVEKISAEIDIVTNHRVEVLGIEKCLEPTEISFLQHKLKSITNRTYLWVTLVIDSIRQTPGFTKGNVHAVIKTLPTTVDDAYEKILARSSDKSKARQLLSIILAATRPLLVEEMTIASAIEEHHKSIDDLKDHLEPVSRAETTIRHICGLFVTIVNSRLCLLHQTARDFLIYKTENTGGPAKPKETEYEQRREAGWKATIISSEAHNLLAQSCVWYLSLLQEPFEYTSFHEYAAINWMTHIREAQAICTNSVIKLAASVCNSTSSNPKSWYSVYCKTDFLFAIRFDSTKFPCTDLMIASYFGLVQVARYLIDSGSNIDAVDEAGLTALSWAIREKQAPIVSLLLEKGANLDLKDIRRRKALDWAITMKDVATIRLCLEKYIANRTQCMKPSLPGFDNNTPITFIGFVYDHQSFEDLLKSQPDLRPLRDTLCSVWFHDPSNNHGLLLASQMGNLELAQSLLDRGVDIDSPDIYGLTPLVEALKHGQIKVVRLLLDRGANIHLRDEKGWTALMYAALYDHSDIVQSLLDNDASINLASDRGYTALMLAADEGNLGITQLLLDRGAEVDPQDREGWTALLYATFRGNAYIAQMLLDKGAAINLASNRGVTALIIASYHGDAEIVQAFLDHGANVNAYDEHGMTALTRAIETDNQEMTYLLLNRGAAVNLADIQGGTPLMRAAVFASVQVAQLLLDHGAEVNLLDSYCMTALKLAARRGYLRMVQLLIQQATNASQGYLWEAVLSASTSNDLRIVKLIIEHETGSTAFEAQINEALKWALKRDCQDLVKVLQDSLGKRILDEKHAHPDDQVALRLPAKPVILPKK